MSLYVYLALCNCIRWRKNDLCKGERGPVFERISISVVIRADISINFCPSQMRAGFTYLNSLEQGILNWFKHFLLPEKRIQRWRDIDKRCCERKRGKNRKRLLLCYLIVCASRSFPDRVKSGREFFCLPRTQAEKMRQGIEWIGWWWWCWSDVVQRKSKSNCKSCLFCFICVNLWWGFLCCATVQTLHRPRSQGLNCDYYGTAVVVFVCTVTTVFWGNGN